jgi:2',3'-cyclic-nucleotide 2'-phosphodiesterase (5'-nucleotidase family)
MKKHLIFLFISSLLVSEHSIAQKQENTQLFYNNIQINNSLKQDSSLIKMLMPYKDSISKTMNKVIGFATNTLNRKQPEGPLGNFFVDVMKLMAERKFERKIDAVIMNSGGIRSYIAKGNVTVGKLYELMPFDNLLVLQEVKGSTLKQFFDHAAAKGGWPVAGITMIINNNKADSILIGGKVLDETATYVIAQSDYVANGGDDSEMLRGIPIINKGYFLRDALIEYIQELTKQGKPVSATIENRVRNANQ